MKKMQRCAWIVAVALVGSPLVFAGCASNENDNTADKNANMTAGVELDDGASEDSADEYLLSEEDVAGMDYPDNEEILDVEETEIIKAGEVRQYAGWYEVAFPNDVEAGESESFFSYLTSQELVYSAEFQCDIANKEEDLPESLIPGAVPINIHDNAKSLAEQAGRDLESDVTTKTIGAYTWYIVNMGGEEGETHCYANIAENEYAYVWFQNMSINNPAAESILSSFKVLPGDPYQNFETWENSHNV